MTTVPLIGAEVPFDELSRRAGAARDEPVQSVKQHTSSLGRSINKKLWKKKFNLYVSQAAEREPVVGGSAGRDELRMQINSALIVRSYQIMNLHFHKLHKELGDDELIAMLMDAYPTILGDDHRLSMTSSYDAHTGGDANDVAVWDSAERACVSAVAFARKTWDEEVYRTIQAKARAGGRAGKKYTREDYVATLGMRKVDIARRLNISRPTVDKMIKEFENEKLESDDD